MRTLIIYDNTGKIFYTASGDVTEPSGLQFMWVDEIPENHYIDHVEFVEGVPTVVFAEYPKSSEDLRFEEIEDAILELSELILGE